MTAMTRQQVPERPISNQRWELLKPLISYPPPAKNSRTGGPRSKDRAALDDVLFVTENGIA
ncbi:hypothetical protein [Kocuria aegyptia]